MYLMLFSFGIILAYPMLVFLGITLIMQAILVWSESRRSYRTWTNTVWHARMSDTTKPASS